MSDRRTRDWHVPLLARLRKAGHNEKPFRHPELLRAAIVGMGALAVVGLTPVYLPQFAPASQRIGTILALWCFLAAPGLWLGMGKRALVISAIIVGVLYGTTAALGLQTHAGDLFVATVIASFFIFAIAGFNLVFVIEEVVYDAHRLLHLRNPIWHILPVVTALVLVLGLPILERRFGLEFPALWAGSWAVLLLLGLWWAARTVRTLPEPMLRELHLFAAGIILATALADAIQYLQEASHLVPSVVALLVLLGTWVYVSYTTLQRTHMLLRRNNAAPWLAILLAASFGIIAHGWALYKLEGHIAVDNLVGQRIAYMVIGVWIGIALLAARSIVRGIDYLRSTLGIRGARVVKQAEKVPGVILRATDAVGVATFEAYRQMDRVLPGAHRAPVRPPPVNDEAEVDD